jgi:hypothetical protein
MVGLSGGHWAGCFFVHVHLPGGSRLSYVSMYGTYVLQRRDNCTVVLC